MRAARDTLRSLLEGISEATLLLNRDLNVLYANTAARMLFTNISVSEGMGFSEFLERALPDTKIGDAITALETAAADAAAGVSKAGDFFLRCAERPMSLRYSGVECGCVCEEQSSEAQHAPVLAVMLREEKGLNHLPRLETVLDSSSDGIFIVNRENHIVYFNLACERLTGWRREAAVMETWECANVLRCHTETGESMGSDSLCPAKLFFSRDSIPEPHEMLITTHSGKEKWIETNYSPIRGETEEVEFIVAIIRDIDERKQLEAQLLQNRNLASLGQLTSGIAHEIKNPLSIIMAGVEVILNENRPEENRREAAQMIKEEVRRLDDRVKDFLAFARVKPLNLEKVNLNALVADIAKNFSSRTNPRVRIELHLSEQKPWLLGDADQLHQAVVNLVINADQAMPHGGKLILETETNEDSVLLRLIDEGSGISPEVRERIFEPFFTTKKEGTGLGLAIVHQIATAHRGKITILNREDGESGVVIELRLPAACMLR